VIFRVFVVFYWWVSSNDKSLTVLYSTCRIYFYSYKIRTHILIPKRKFHLLSNLMILHIHVHSPSYQMGMGQNLVPL
jgi:hypothetical protein